MSTLILYATKHGCTRKAALMLDQRLDDKVTVRDIDEPGLIDLEPFDTVIVGGSIHAGRLQNKLQRYCEQNAKTLMEKRLGLYLCCMYEGDQRQLQFERAFPKKLQEHACCIGFFGGELHLDKMNVVERAVVKKVAGVSESVYKFNEQSVLEFARDIIENRLERGTS